MNWLWLMIPSHILAVLAGALAYRKHHQWLEALRIQFDLLVGLFRRK